MRLNKSSFPAAQLILTGVLCFVSLLSILYVLLTNGVLFDIFYCLATIPFVCLPLLLGLLFKWRFNTVFYIVFSFYAFGPLLGAVYKLYYMTSWWDDLLHILAGTIFAVCGAQLAYSLNGKQQVNYVFAAIFGVFLSMAIAVFWEIFEFSADMLMGTDMQADSVVYTIATKLGRTDGGLTVFENIRNVTIDGKPLGFGGYVDIGLIDTMRDMIVETVGALLYLVYALLDRDRHPMIRCLTTKKNAA